MQSLPLVSVIVPVYNCGALISETLASVQGQSVSDWELILVDDYSSDNTQEVLYSYARSDPRINLLSLPANSGRPAVPRNTGLQRARGEYIAFLDADDIWHRQKLELQLDFMERYNCQFCSSSLIDFVDISHISSEISRKIDVGMIPVEKIRHSRLLLKNRIPNSSVCLKRSLISEFQFQEDMRYKAIEDYDLWLRLHQRIPYSIKIKVPLLFYRKSNSGISKKKYSMLKKNYMMYSEYRVNGNPLGLARFLYLTSYMFFSLFRQLKGKF
jgi:teichuronic acid biosynthesis glycosyltransferase TuaG